MQQPAEVQPAPQAPADPLPPVVAAVPGARPSKKLKKRGRPPAPEDFVNVVPVRPKDGKEEPMQLSKLRKSKLMKVSTDQKCVTSSGGYRSVMSTRGVHVGTWYFEIEIVVLGATGHCRLGVGTERQEVDGPCGYTEHSFGYRDVDGSKVHKAWRHPYGDGYKEGDVIGVYLHLPEGGRTMEGNAEIVKWKGRLFQMENEPAEPAQPLVGSMLGFTVNGKWQGPAFTDIPEGTYYATGSLFTAPHPPKAAALRFNFGPDFKFAPPTGEGLHPAKPLGTAPAVVEAPAAPEAEAAEPAPPQAAATEAAAVAAPIVKPEEGTASMPVA